MGHAEEMLSLSRGKKRKKAKPTITIYIEGGCVHGWKSKGVKGLQVDIVDYDTEGAEEGRLCECKKGCEPQIHLEV
jgi:hypothetical protein